MMRISNIGLGAIRPPNRMAFQLGVSPAEVLAVTPDSMPPQKVPQLPVTTDEANNARRTYRVSADALFGVDGKGGEVYNLSIIKPADGKEPFGLVMTYCKTQYDTIVKSCRGRTGDSDAEVELEYKWWGLWDRATWFYNHPPSFWAQAVDVIKRFINDFIAGVQQAWQDYADWALKNSGPLLRNYHSSLTRLAELKADFQAASASGNFSAGQLMSQEASIASADSAVKMVRDTYRLVSAGSDIDKLAVDEYGPYSMDGPPAAGAIITVILIGALIIALGIAIDSMQKLVDPFLEASKAALDSVKKLFTDNPVGAIIGVGVIGAMIALPFVLFRGPSAPQAVPMKPSPSEAT